MIRNQLHKFKFLTLLVLGFVAIASNAQNFSSHNWYFGNNNQGIRFSRSNNTASIVTNQATPFGTGGSAVASNPINGDLMFYTDGSRVFDLSHVQMPNGFGLNGTVANNQPVALTAIPGTPNQYYIFTNNGSISVTTVDMTQFGNAAFPAPPFGDVAAKNVAVGLAGRAQGMITIPHANGIDYWLITQESGTPNYTVTLVDAGGFTHTTFAGLGFNINVANLSYHAGTGRIAASPSGPTTDIAILDFDNATGILTFNQFVLSSGLASTVAPTYYDTEWSANGQYLYLSRTGEAGIQANVFQYDLLNPTTTLASVLPQPTTIFRSYGLQMAPDTTIYHVYQAISGGPFLLGRISDTDSIAANVRYNPTAFAGNFSGSQFSSFLPRMDQNIVVNFTSFGNCSNAPTSFFPTVSPGADSLRWDFGDGSGSSDWAPVHTYQNGGTFPVNVTAFLNGQASVPVPQNINITQFDLQISLVQDTTACSCELPFPKATPPPPSCGTFQVTAQVNGGAPVSTQWFGPSGLLVGQNTTTLSPDSAGYYYIVVTDATGCSTYAGVNIKEYDIQDQRANIWYFGNNAGIDFNPLPDGPAVPISNPVMNAPEGTSTISDRNGQVLFFTDGDKVWDRNFVEIGTGIGGDPTSAQAAIIIPVPGDETLYYIFTTQEVHGTGLYEARYSLFDLKLNSGTGGLVEQNVLLFSRSTERIASNGNWVIFHEYGNNSFRAYQITSLGIGNPVISSIGSDHNLATQENGQGYMRLGPQSQLVVALPGASNTIELFDFDNSTGMVENFRSIVLSDGNGDVYGLEFSPGGRKLFASLLGNQLLFELAYDSVTMTYVERPELPPIATPGQIGGMQIGPDGRIYVATDGSGSLGTIDAIETNIIPSVYTPAGFGLLGGTNSNLGMPNFTQIIADPTQAPSLFAVGECLGSPTDFFASGKDSNIDMFDWFFGDGAGLVDGGPQVSHTYAAAGTYTVTVIVYNKCENPAATLTYDITINAPPANPTFLPPGGVPVLCTGSLTLEATPATNPNLANLTFLWSTGETTRTIVVDQQSIVNVTIINQFGCTSNGSLLIADNRPIVNLGPDLTICQNTPIFPLDAQNTGTNYAWTINGVPAGSSQTQSVDTSLPGFFEYIVQVTDPITTCSVSDTISYTINESPAFVATPFNPITCGVDDGRIEVNITSPPTTLFTYSIVGPSSDGASDVGIGLYTTPATLAAGVYGVSVVDQVSGCFTITTVNLNNPALTVAAIQNGTCDPIPIQVTPTLAGGTYRVINAVTAVEVIPPTVVVVAANTPFNTTGVVSGDYTVEFTSGSGCISSANVTVTQNIPVDIGFSTLDICNRNVTATSSLVGVTFDWSASPVGSINGASIGATVNINPGTWNLVVTGTNGGVNCPGIGNITVTVDPPVTPDFTQTDACADIVTLAATPTGGFTYRWFRNGVLIPGGSQIQAGLADNGIQYRVDVVSAATGCVYASAAKTVQVSGDPQLVLTAGPACEGTPFLLTANTNPAVTPSYAWSLNGSIISGATSSTHTDTRGGLYQVTVTLPGCTRQDDIQVVLAPLTPGNLNDRYIICDDPANTDPTTNQVLLDPGNTFLSYDWYKDGVQLNVFDPTFTAMEPGTYSVDLINSFGCASTDQSLIERECSPKINGPNAFRPEGSNSEFFLYTFFISDEDFQIFIFNRWGEMVFESPDRNFRWNGGLNNVLGKPVPSGTYSYVVKYKSSYRPERGVQETRGGVIVLR